jgi:hypothetical protein
VTAALRQGAPVSPGQNDGRKGVLPWALKLPARFLGMFKKLTPIQLLKNLARVLFCCYVRG